MVSNSTYLSAIWPQASYSDSACDGGRGKAVYAASQADVAGRELLIDVADFGAAFHADHRERLLAG
jgi:hypothetical protein